MAFNLFIFINAFIIGGLAVLGFLHLYAHRASKKVQPKAQTEIRIPRTVKERIIEEAEAHMRLILNTNAKEIGRDLSETTSRMTNQIEKVISETIEMQRSTSVAAQAAVVDAGAQAVEKLSEVSVADKTALDAAYETSKAEFEQKLNASLDQRRQQAIQQIDTSLSDAVVSFLLDTLGHEVDLGSQTSYIIARLEENKDLFKESVRA